MGRVTAVGVLGPLRVEGPDGPVEIGSARQRRLLVALAAHPGRVVGAELLTELVWETMPADPAGALHTTVSRLRRALPPPARIATEGEGYRLLAEVDVAVFAAHLAAAGRDPQRYAPALALWRGRPFAELDHPALQPEVARLVELRAAAVEGHAQALLDTGRAGEAVAALEALVVAEPLREGAVALLMRALVAAGRQGAALAAYARLRTRLADELGLDPAPDLRELEQQVLRQELRPQAPGVAPRGPWLPVSTFVGRDAELAAIAALLVDRRVVTLCGPGGVGKTRLALHVAAAVADRYDDGVLVVELGDGGPGDVEAVLAAALRLSGGGALADRIVEVLAVRRQLLLLDNCEHVADEAAALVEAIARAAPGVDLLLTSREPLRVDAEQVVALTPLGLDAATALLADRLAAAGGAQPPDAQLRELCRRLDGLPLALELAAGRAASLGLRGLIEALAGDDTFEVLRGGRRTAAARHRSLADVVEWSHALLDDDQRVLFERLAVFAGPVERAAVAAVCGDAAALPDLVERSLVVRHPGGEAIPISPISPSPPDRFGMLETLRAYGRSKLARDPAGSALRARHAAWAVRLAEELGVARRGPDEPAAVRRFDAHLADLRRAHAWLCANGPADDLLRLSVLFGELAYVRGRVDLSRLVEETLAAVDVSAPGRVASTAHPLVPRLLGLLAASGWQRGDLAVCEAWARRAIAIADTCADPSAAAAAYEALANVAGFRGDLAAEQRYARRAVEFAKATDDDGVQVLALVDLACNAAYSGDHAGADRYEAELASREPAIGSRTSRAWLDYVRGEIRAERGDPSAAGYLRAAIRAAEEVDSGFVAGVARHTLLTAAARVGDPAVALTAFGPLIDHWHGFGAWTQLWMAMRALVETLSRLGRDRDAAVLLGALAASPRASSVYGSDSERLAAVREAARTALGDGFAAALAEGASLGEPGAVALARRFTRT
jgi:predicted ATPase/DNA-binding SARP family transcriptional activator